jgi:chromosome segregation ATPase
MARGAGSGGNGRRVSSDREGDLVLGDSSLERAVSLGEGGLRALLTQAAAERQSTLEYFRRNPSECSLEKRASRRLNRDDGELPENNNSAEAPAHQRTRAEAPAELPSEKPASMSTSLAPQQQSNQEAASATVHAERPANASVPNASVPYASASEQSKDVDERHRTVAEESPSKDTKSQSRQLLETRAELRRLQGVLKAERDAVADLTARLQDSQTECDKLQDQVTELAKQAAESQKVQKTDIEEISDELLEELEQEIDDLRGKLEASESWNTTQQAEWESIKQELTAEIQELKSKLAGAQAEIDELKSKLAGSAVSAKKDQQAEDQDKDNALAGGINAKAKTTDVAGLSAELSGEMQELKRKLAGAERARKKADAESDKQLLDLKCQLEEALEMLEGTPEYDAIMEILMTVKPKSKKGAGAPAQVDVCTQATAPEKGQGEAVCAEDVLQRMLHKMCVAAALRQW